MLHIVTVELGKLNISLLSTVSIFQMDLLLHYKGRADNACYGSAEKQEQSESSNHVILEDFCLDC